MKGRAFIPLIIGLGIGVMALKVFIGVVQRAKGSTGEAVPVVCATADIEPTMEIRDSMVEVKSVPKSLAPPLAFQKTQDVVGRVTSLTIAQGMPVVPVLLTPKGTPPGMAVRIREGYRAVAVTIDESAGVAGWLKPGCRVDVVVLMTGRRVNKSEKISKVILQNVEVLAVGQDSGTKRDTAAALAHSVTLLVHPDDVPKLHLAATEGKLRLAMRNQLDYSRAPKGMTTDDDLWAVAPDKSGEKPESKPSWLLSSLFGLQPLQNKGAATDNRERDAAPAVQVALAGPNHPWSVEVMKGPGKSELLWFEDESRAARRIGGPDGAGRTSGGLEALLMPAHMPAANVPLMGGPRPPDASSRAEHVVEPRPRQAPNRAPAPAKTMESAE